MERARRLTDIANDTGTDKGTVHNGAHAYTLVYESLLEGFRGRPINLMEIGLAIGGPEHGFPSSRTVTDVPSIRMWREYFPLASIYGVDISDFSKFETDWFKFYQADCGDAERLDSVANALAANDITFDVIIDDASHASFHQQLTFLKFFERLKPGGLYIIEDMSWVPEGYEQQLPKVPRTRDVFAQILQSGHVTDAGSIGIAAWEKVLPDVGAILTFDGLYLADLRRDYEFRSLSRNGGQASPPEISVLRRLYKSGRSIVRQLRGERVSPHVRQTELAVLQRLPGRAEIATGT